MYTVKELELIKKPGCWGLKRFGVFENDTQIGEFTRNYKSYGEDTFAPFRRGDKWYALYSPCYEHICVMELPSCKQIGNNNGHFCPVEILVPTFQVQKTLAKKPEDLHKYPEQNHKWLSKDRYEKEFDQDLWYSNNDQWEMLPEIHYEQFALVAGCFWGDDSSWKVECLDISDAHNGNLKFVDNWGYHELAPYSLKECVRFHSQSSFDNDMKQNVYMNISVTRDFRLDMKDKIKVLLND